MRVESNGQGEDHYKLVIDETSLTQLLQLENTSPNCSEERKPPLEVEVAEGVKLWLIPDHHTTSPFFKQHLTNRSLFYANIGHLKLDDKLPAFAKFIDSLDEMPIQYRNGDIYGYVKLTTELKQP
ncbi:hypothetical protein HN953_00845 [Candidatus Woesearchaeota archaeon]|mgnify:CR=1 FL=1|jgi:hypothetical protein|nr:hypothetical protein [Candidatus Woesearchaeota archaeon]